MKNVWTNFKCNIFNYLIFQTYQHMYTVSLYRSFIILFTQYLYIYKQELCKLIIFVFDLHIGSINNKKNALLEILYTDLVT